jgi:hypothetical protein
VECRPAVPAAERDAADAGHAAGARGFPAGGGARVRPTDLRVCGGKTWENAADVIFQRLAGRFGSQVAFEFIQLFSPEFFQFSQVMARVQDGSAHVPIITVDDEIVQSGGKISERTIREALEARGLTVTPTA